jgi:hypothetical protein
MRLSQLAAKPQLVKISITDPELTARYSNSEPIEFWTWDRQPMDVFMRLANVNTASGDAGLMIDTVRALILDEDGTEIIRDGASLPGPVLVRAITEIVGALGK